jgi:hypothetical protein
MDTRAIFFFVIRYGMNRERDHPMNHTKHAWSASSSRQNQAPVSVRLYVLKPIIGEHLEKHEHCSVQWDPLEAYPAFQSFLAGITLPPEEREAFTTPQDLDNNDDQRDFPETPENWETIYRIIDTAQTENGKWKIYVALVLPPNETPGKFNDSTKVRLTVFVRSEDTPDDKLVSESHVFGFPPDMARNHFLRNVPW